MSLKQNLDEPWYISVLGMLLIIFPFWLFFTYSGHDFLRYLINLIK
jgi:hypothetical protein